MLLSWKNSLKIPSIGRLKSVAVMVEEFVRFRNEKTVPNKPLLLPLFLLYSSCSIQSLLKSQPRPDCMTFGLNINSLGLFPPGGLRGERVEDAVARVSCNWKDRSSRGTQAQVFTPTGTTLKGHLSSQAPTGVAKTSQLWASQSQFLLCPISCFLHSRPEFAPRAFLHKLLTCHVPTPLGGGLLPRKLYLP